MTDQEIIDKVRNEVYLNNYRPLQGSYTYLWHVLVRYARWIERDKSLREVRGWLTEAANGFAAGTPGHICFIQLAKGVK